MAQSMAQAPCWLLRAAERTSHKMALRSSSLVGGIEGRSQARAWHQQQRNLSTSRSASSSSSSSMRFFGQSTGVERSHHLQSSSWRRDQPSSLFGGKKLATSRGSLLSHKAFSSSAVQMHGGKGRPAPGTGIKVTFMNSKGEEIKTVEGNEGDDIVDLSWEYDLDIEAACEKSIACSTCHVILDPESYDKLEEPSDEENDMLDMAFGLEDTSRLGCQVKLTRDLDGMKVKLPSATRNFAVDGHKSKH